MSPTATDEFNDLLHNNTASRLTSHPSDAHNDSDDARSFLNLSSDEDDHTPVPPSLHPEDDNDPPPRASSSFPRNTIPTTRYAANTGPKGVISDAQNFRDSRRSRRISTQSSAALQQGYTSRAVPTSATFTTNGAGPPVYEEKVPEENEEDEDGLADDDVEDDEFMREWRQSRLREMQNGGRGTMMRGGGRGGEMVGRGRRGVWGGLPTVDGMGYLEAVDQSPADTVVVVFIYDDYVSPFLSFPSLPLPSLLCSSSDLTPHTPQSEVSSLLESHIRALAARHPDVRFVRLHFRDAEMEPMGVPALLAYRGGEKFAGLVPIVDEIPDDAELSDAVLESVLRRYVFSFLLPKGVCVVGFG